MAKKTVKQVLKKIYKTGKQIPTYALLFALAALMLFPFFWMITGSLKTYNEITSNPIVWWPETVQWGNYAEALDYAPFDIFFVNTVIVCVANTVITLFTTILAAFAFSRLKFRGQKVLFVMLLATLMIPSQLLIITNYKTVAVDLHLKDTLWALIIPFTASAFYIYLLRQFFVGIPDEYYYAAKVDGCNDWQYLWKIMVPNTKNALITIALFNWIASWNAYIWPLLITDSVEKRVLAIGLKYFSNEAGTDFHLLMAAGTIVVLPLVILYIFTNRYILEGVAQGGIKG
jgi:multiple sugar transport system permease protein